MKLAAIRMRLNRATSRRNRSQIQRRLMLRDPYALPEVPRRFRAERSAV